jgi:hypothetical protein
VRHGRQSLRLAAGAGEWRFEAVKVLLAMWT